MERERKEKDAKRVTMGGSSRAQGVRDRLPSGGCRKGEKEPKGERMKENKEKKNESAEAAEEIVDAKGTTAVAVQGSTQVQAAPVTVRGGSLEYATMMPFYSVCGLPDAFKRQCHEGDVVLKRGSDAAFRLMEPGDKPVKAIVLDGQQAVLEGRPIGGDLPRVWCVGRPAPGGEVPATIADCWRIAEADAPGVRKYRFEDYSRATNPIPEHYLAEALYLRLLVQVPDSIPDAFSLVTIGGGIYAPATILFKKFDVIGVKRFFNNIQVREAARHAGDASWTWSPAGQFVSVGVSGRAFKRPNGTDGTIWTLNLGRLLGDDGMIYKPTDAESDDLARLFTGLADDTASVDDVGNGEF